MPSEAVSTLSALFQPAALVILYQRLAGRGGLRVKKGAAALTAVGVALILCSGTVAAAQSAAVLFLTALGVVCGLALKRSFLCAAMTLCCAQLGYCASDFVITTLNKGALLSRVDAGLLPLVAPFGDALAFAAAACLCSRLSSGGRARSTQVLLPFAPLALVWAVSDWINRSVYGCTATVCVAPCFSLCDLAPPLVTTLCALCLTAVLDISKRLQLASCDREEKARYAALCESYARRANERYCTARAARHDLRNHAVALSGLITNGQNEGALDYLRRVGLSEGTLTFPCVTGSPALDALLEDKTELAASLGVRLRCSVAIPRFLIGLVPELCTVAANALDNAIAAAARAERARRYALIASESQGNMFVLYVENGCAGVSAPEEGTGLFSIRRAVQRCEGRLEIKSDGKAFRLTVFIDISRP